MKNLIKVIALASCLTAAVAVADEPQAQIRGGAHACVSGLDGDVCSHFFGETDVTIFLNAATAGCGPLKGVLLQMSTRLEAPIDGAVTPASFDGCKPQEVTVRLPKVNSETEFHVIFSGTDARVPAVVVPLKAYPRALLDAIRDWTKDDRNALVVRDKDGKFMEFLDRNKIEYSGSGAAPSKAHKVTIMVADPDDMTGDKPDGDVLYLAEKVKDLPVVSVEHTAQGATATADMKLIDGLAADDPLAEQAFSKIFAMIIK